MTGTKKTLLHIAGGSSGDPLSTTLYGSSLGIQGIRDQFPEIDVLPVSNLRDIQSVLSSSGYMGRDKLDVEDIVLAVAYCRLDNGKRGWEAMELLRQRGYACPAIYYGCKQCDNSPPKEKEQLFTENLHWDKSFSEVDNIGKRIKEILSESQ